MQKTVVLLLALYAAAVSTLLLLGMVGPKAATTAGAGADGAHDPGGADLRKAITEAKRQAQKVYQANVLKQEARLARHNELVEEMAERLKDLDTWIEDLSRRNAGGMDAIVKDLEALRPMAEQYKGLLANLQALEKRVKEVEDRPPVVREIIKTTGPAKPTEPTKPDVPTLPIKKEEDPAVVQEKIAKAMQGLASNKLAQLWPAIETMRKYKVKAAAPRLIEILQTSKEKFAKQAAATALGEIQWADAVLPLADALKDDPGVAQLASKAILKITGFDPELSHSARAKERTRARNAVIAWWRGNEETVRQRLGQPKS